MPLGGGVQPAALDAGELEGATAALRDVRAYGADHVAYGKLRACYSTHGAYGATRCAVLTSRM
eukprot:2657702-Rhodomonas_salina.2